jgi:hypothetical protein
MWYLSCLGRHSHFRGVRSYLDGASACGKSAGRTADAIAKKVRRGAKDRCLPVTFSVRRTSKRGHASVLGVKYCRNRQDRSALIGSPVMVSQMNATTT